MILMRRIPFFADFPMNRICRRQHFFLQSHPLFLRHSAPFAHGSIQLGVRSLELLNDTLCPYIPHGRRDDSQPSLGNHTFNGIWLIHAVYALANLKAKIAKNPHTPRTIMHEFGT